MGQSEWALVTGSATTSTEGPTQVVAGASRVIPDGPTGVSYIARSLIATPVVRALRINQAGFDPTTRGGSSHAALRRGPGGVPFVFFALQTDDVNASTYMLGLDADGCLGLRKGALVAGVPAEAPGGDGQILRRSLESFHEDAWVHVKLAVIVNSNGDVVLRVFQSDLLANPHTAPTWAPVPGMGTFIDDCAAVHTGSLPLVGGYCGFGVHLSEAGAWAAVTCAGASRQP